jgi:hypothetical protein
MAFLAETIPIDMNTLLIEQDGTLEVSFDRIGIERLFCSV